MTKNCKSCKQKIGPKDPVYQCVACSANLHLTTSCTGLTPVVVNGIKDLGTLAMLLCSSCHENNVRDRFIRNFTQSKLTEKLEELDINEKLQNMENRLTQIVEKKVDEALRNTCEKVEKTYSTVLTGNNKNAVPKEQQNRTNHNINQCIRIQGIAEDPQKSKAENLVPTNEEVKKILEIVDEQPNIVEMKRLGKFDEKRTKPRTLLLTVANHHEARLVLAKSLEKRTQLSERKVFLSPALTKEDAAKENQILKKRRELITEGVPKEKLRIRNLELFNDNVKVELNESGP